MKLITCSLLVVSSVAIAQPEKVVFTKAGVGRVKIDKKPPSAAALKGFAVTAKAHGDIDGNLAVSTASRGGKPQFRWIVDTEAEPPTVRSIAILDPGVETFLGVRVGATFEQTGAQSCEAPHKASDVYEQFGYELYHCALQSPKGLACTANFKVAGAKLRPDDETKTLAKAAATKELAGHKAVEIECAKDHSF